MNGAESLVKTFLANGVDTVFANPGTSEMHFVAALDAHPEMRCILCLFEGGASGAADAYFRMSGKVAGTLLHLAPGFGNAYANLHNARKAPSGIVNVVGDHATHHLRYESPLKGDVVGVSQAVSHWTRVSPDAESVARDGADAIRVARSGNGQIATLILPANTAWEAASHVAQSAAPHTLDRPSEAEIAAAAKALRSPGAALMIGGAALHGDLRQLAGRIAAKTGARLMGDTLVARQSRGAGVAMLDQLPYPVAPKIESLKGTQTLILVGTHRPVAFFAYPGKPSRPEPAGCRIDPLCAPEMDIAYTLQALADACGVDAHVQPKVYPLDLPDLPTGDLTLEKVGQAIAALLPENAIICNESITSGFTVMPPSLTARPHDVIGGTGGSIGLCLPAATGAAAACPDRKVLALTGDGSAMYTLQSLWTMAREQQDVTVVVFANRGYQILRDELANVGVNSYGQNARAMFDVHSPELDWVALAKGNGVPGQRVTQAEAFVDALRDGFATSGPSLIEVAC
ncbi:acetolactate synthase-1/2/3 large subunit [Litoreibacter ponti]|uniref:Acetolactate synthase-1/2/3 large subunit n=1 Tax=Litoreibacter ponti TaxID=1510457 RepID=A0A2T6BIY8_9RHOB|nr:acetolactate synthase large subunit [Litoreibacter ponti]PTX56030.1 acetolactate synthase-1/2/3 large subunit [Litoreibacter ponti]